MRKYEEPKQYLFVVRQLVAREIKRKYSRSYLGILWSVLNPLLNMVVLSFIFTQMFSRSIENYPLYLLSGQTIWQLFTGATNSAMTSVAVSYTHLDVYKRQQFEMNNVTLLQEMGYEIHYASNFDRPVYDYDKNLFRQNKIITHHLYIEKSPVHLSLIHIYQRWIRIFSQN